MGLRVRVRVGGLTVYWSAVKTSNDSGDWAEGFRAVFSPSLNTAIYLQGEWLDLDVTEIKETADFLKLTKVLFCRYAFFKDPALLKLINKFWLCKPAIA